MPQPSELASCLKALHLSLAAECYPDIAAEARQEQLSLERFLLLLMGRVLENRMDNRIARWLHESRLPREKSLANFESLAAA